MTETRPHLHPPIRINKGSVENSALKHIKHVYRDGFVMRLEILALILHGAVFYLFHYFSQMKKKRQQRK